MTIKNIVQSMIFGLAAGLLLTMGLLTLGNKTNEVIFGASELMIKVYVAVICLVSCICAEAVADTSAREVFIDIFISIAATWLCVGKETLNINDAVGSLTSVMLPVTISVLIAVCISDPIKTQLEKILDKQLKK